MGVSENKIGLPKSFHFECTKSDHRWIWDHQTSASIAVGPGLYRHASPGDVASTAAHRALDPTIQGTGHQVGKSLRRSFGGFRKWEHAIMDGLKKTTGNLETHSEPHPAKHHWPNMKIMAPLHRIRHHRVVLELAWGVELRHRLVERNTGQTCPQCCMVDQTCTTQTRTPSVEIHTVITIVRPIRLNDLKRSWK